MQRAFTIFVIVSFDFHFHYHDFRSAPRYRLAPKCGREACLPYYSVHDGRYGLPRLGRRYVDIDAARFRPLASRGILYAHFLSPTRTVLYIRPASLACFKATARRAYRRFSYIT